MIREPIKNKKMVVSAKFFALTRENLNKLMAHFKQMMAEFLYCSISLGQLPHPITYNPYDSLI